MTEPGPWTTEEVLTLAREERWLELLERLADHVRRHPDVVEQLTPKAQVSGSHFRRPSWMPA